MPPQERSDQLRRRGSEGKIRARQSPCRRKAKPVNQRPRCESPGKTKRKNRVKSVENHSPDRRWDIEKSVSKDRVGEIGKKNGDFQRQNADKIQATSEKASSALPDKDELTKVKPKKKNSSGKTKQTKKAEVVPDKSEIRANYSHVTRIRHNAIPPLTSDRLPVSVTSNGLKKEVTRAPKGRSENVKRGVGKSTPKRSKSRNTQIKVSKHEESNKFNENVKEKVRVKSANNMIRHTKQCKGENEKYLDKQSVEQSDRVTPRSTLSISRIRGQTCINKEGEVIHHITCAEMRNAGGDASVKSKNEGSINADICINATKDPGRKSYIDLTKSNFTPAPPNSPKTDYRAQNFTRRVQSANQMKSQSKVTKPLQRDIIRKSVHCTGAKNPSNNSPAKIRKNVHSCSLPNFSLTPINHSEDSQRSVGSSCSVADSWTPCATNRSSDTSTWCSDSLTTVSLLGTTNAFFDTSIDTVATARSTLSAAVLCLSDRSSHLSSTPRSSDPSTWSELRSTSLSIAKIDGDDGNSFSATTPRSGCRISNMFSSSSTLRSRDKFTRGHSDSLDSLASIPSIASDSTISTRSGKVEEEVRKLPNPKPEVVFIWHPRTRTICTPA